MKKLISLLLATTMALSMVACGGGEKTTEVQNESNNGKYEIALVTDVGTIDDKSFNQGSWEGTAKYAREAGISHKYYQPAEKSNEAITASIELAIKGGAKTVVCPGFLFEVPVYNMQQKYPDVNFILIDGAPKSSDAEDAEYLIAENTVSIYYAEQEAGFLAGYASVMEGYRNLGFMGGIAVPAVIKFGYGFVQGADYAAKELGLAKDDVKMNYTYVGNFEASPDNMAKASAWFNEGVEVIFACGGGVGNSVMKAAESIDGKKVIGVDIDQSFESETVITSAMKNLQKSVYEELKSVYNGTFEGGKSVILGSDTNNVLLPMETSRFGYGFVQGADYAAKELGLAKDDVKMNYTYVGNFEASPDNTAKAATWFNEGVEVIFACAGAAGNSIMKAAESIDGKKVIGVDVDQSFESETVITSAMKNLQKSVYEELKSVYNGTFEGGKSVILGSDTNNVLLPMETSRFENFTEEEYNKIYEKIVNKEVEVADDTIAEEASDIPTEIISVNVQ